MSSVGFTQGYNNSMGQGFSAFGAKSAVEGSKEFLMSNTIIAKLSFLLLVIIAFFIILRLGTQFIVWYNQPDPNPYVVTCRRDGELSKEIPVNPKIKNSIPILRSKDEREGVEFTWSLWLYVDKPHAGNSASGQESSPRYYHIFHKGTLAGTQGILSRSGAHDATPGLYLMAKQTDATSNSNSTLTNSLVAVTNTFKGNTASAEEGGLDGLEKTTVIESLPIRKWIHVAIRVENKNFDVYVNGVLANRRVLESLPRQNYGNVYLGQRDSTNVEFGFRGEISSLRYFNNALNPVEINNIVRVGPNMCTDESAAQYPPYLSHKWYL
tara:strand:- start:938 stop:1909 length:972 start_codon:yes stop_codon:yes gene_type:complete